MNKEKELECLKIINKKKLFNKNIVFEENERPDFVSKDKTIGIEHFLVDVLERSKKKGSLSRKQDNSIEEKIKNYKNAPDEVLENDIKSGAATEFILEKLNKPLNEIRDFDYEKFKNNFIRIYKEHYKNIDVYKEKADKIFFLIEIRYPNPIVNKFGYIIEDNKNKRYQSVKGIPLPKEAINMFKNSEKLDGIILCFVPYEYTSNKLEKYKIIKIENKDFDSFEGVDGIVVCNKFDYSVKFKDDIMITFPTINEQENK